MWMVILWLNSPCFFAVVIKWSREKKRQINWLNWFQEKPLLPFLFCSIQCLNNPEIELGESCQHISVSSALIFKWIVFICFYPPIALALCEHLYSLVCSWKEKKKKKASVFQYNGKLILFLWAKELYSDRIKVGLCKRPIISTDIVQICHSANEYYYVIDQTKFMKII